MEDYELIDINLENISDFPQVICFINPKDPTFRLKVDWLEKRFAEGLKITALKQAGAIKIAGFIESVPGEFAWRAVDCKDFMFIHCLWVSSKSDRDKGYGSALVGSVVDQAKKLGKNGVCVLTSNDAFMAKNALFGKLGFKECDSTKIYKLMCLDFEGKTESKPRILDNSSRLKTMKGWHVLYSRQCPWVARLITEMKPVFERNGVDVVVEEIKSAKEAQAAPSIYGVLNLVHDGKILSERYISTTRLQNIIGKELGLKRKRPCSEVECS